MDAMEDNVTKPPKTTIANFWGAAFAIPVVMGLAACSNTASLNSGADLLKAPTGLVTSSVEALANVPLPKLDPDPVGSPTELYTRIARGAGVCWFGTHGALKATHIFHADAEPASRGGRSEIVIHEKDTKMPNPRGNRAFRVEIAPSGDNASLVIENSRFPLEVGQKMTADVRRWARNDLTCSDSVQTKGWDAINGPEPKAPALAPAKTGERRT